MARHRGRPAVVAAMTDRQRGFALLIVLWTVAFLALLGTQIVAAGRSDTQLADNLRQQAVLEAAAAGAIQDVTFHILGAKDPKFQTYGVTSELRIGETPVLVRLENEGDRVNLNTASMALLRSLVTEVGAPGLADRLAAAITAWRASAANARSRGATAADYQAAGRDYGPPGTPFESVGELADVLEMSPDLFARMAPHLTVLTDGDPDMSTRDPVVARALTDAAGVADASGAAQQTADLLLRITVTAVGRGAARYSTVAVVSGDFQNSTPRVNVLLRERGTALTKDAVAKLDVRPGEVVE
jgi:general secretion pathway protein K